MSNKSKPSDNCNIEYSSSESVEILNLRKRIHNLRTAQRDIEINCICLEDQLRQLELKERSIPSSVASYPSSYYSAQSTSQSTIASESVHNRYSSKSTLKSFKTHRNTSNAQKRDSSFSRIRGTCAIPNKPLNFDQRPPFFEGDVVEIKNPRDAEYGKQEVINNKSSTFYYFSNDREVFQRAPQNLKRIHQSDYHPGTSKKLIHTIEFVTRGS